MTFLPQPMASSLTLAREAKSRMYPPVGSRHLGWRIERHHRTTLSRKCQIEFRARSEINVSPLSLVEATLCQICGKSNRDLTRRLMHGTRTQASELAIAIRRRGRERPGTMLQFLKRCLGRFQGDLKTSERDKKDIYDPELYPVYPPAIPSEIIAKRAAYRAKLQKLRYAAPPGETTDQPLYALYRLYEWFLLDYVTAYRDELEHFWRQKDWRICDLPDPKDPDPARYAFLAGITDLLVRSFNRKIDYGASRSAPAIMTEQYADSLVAIPKEKRPWEERPSWADTVPKLQNVLSVPTHDDEMLEGLQDPKADPYFKTKNIILWTPHMHFT